MSPSSSIRAATLQCLRIMLKHVSIALELCGHGFPWLICSSFDLPANEQDSEKTQAFMVGDSRLRRRV